MDDATIRVLVDEIVDQMVDTRVPRLMPATVIAYESQQNVTVVVDGDTTFTYTTSIIGPVLVGARVMLTFYPPSGCVITGIINDAFRGYAIHPTVSYHVNGDAFSGVDLEQTIATLTMDAQPVTGTAFVAGHVFVTKTTAADRAEMFVRYDGTTIVARGISDAGTSSTVATLNATNGVNIPDTNAHIFTMTVLRTAGGAGTISTQAIGSLNNLSVIFVPGPQPPP